jgi:S1-C subfamily serine protease
MITVGGYNVGFFYPLAVVFAADAKDFKQLWSGSTISSSKNADVRLPGQFMLLGLIASDFPACANRAGTMKGYLGIGFQPLSRDGNSYFPTILNVEARSPAKRAGLRQFDQIVAVNDRSAENTSIQEFIEMGGAPGEAIRLKVRRQEKLKDITVVLGEHPAGR